MDEIDAVDAARYLRGGGGRRPGHIVSGGTGAFASAARDSTGQDWTDAREGRVVDALHRRPADSAEHGGPGKSHEIHVLGRVGRALEHAEHAVCDEESASDVDSRRADGDRGESLRDVGWHERVGKEDEASARSGRNVLLALTVSGAKREGQVASAPDGGDTANGIGDAHQRRVERRLNSPHGLIPADDGKPKLGQHARERWRRVAERERHDAAEAGCGGDGGAHRGLVRILRVGLERLGGLSLLRRRGRDWERRRRPAGGEEATTAASAAAAVQVTIYE